MLQILQGNYSYKQLGKLDSKIGNNSAYGHLPIYARVTCNIVTRLKNGYVDTREKN